MKRRDFILSSSAGIASAAWGTRLHAVVAESAESRLQGQIRQAMHEYHVPGLAAVLVRKDGPVWSGAFGFSDVESRRPMTLDSIQNIGSISKTVTATAVMQLVERGLLDLDSDINAYLSVPIRNPNHPGVPITMRHLLVHTSSLRDGSNYSRNYACGDPRLSLAPWVRAFFTSGGSYYVAEENFEKWAPGEAWQYCNVSFSVMALVVEAISGLAFPVYCERNIFSHLHMDSTAWMLADIDQDRHSTPYSWIDEEEVRGGSWGGLPVGVVTADGPTLDRQLASGYHVNCLYNHPNYPDGFLRTSAHDLTRYLLAYMNGGIYGGRRILREDTVRSMFEPQTLPKGEEKKRTYGLTWYALHEYNGEKMWGHGGGDPGVTTNIIFLAKQDLGVLVLTNTYSMAVKDVTLRLLDYGSALASSAD